MLIYKFFVSITISPKINGIYFEKRPNFVYFFLNLINLMDLRPFIFYFEDGI